MSVLDLDSEVDGPCPVFKEDAPSSTPLMQAKHLYLGRRGLTGIACLDLAALDSTINSDATVVANLLSNLRRRHNDFGPEEKKSDINESAGNYSCFPSSYFVNQNFAPEKFILPEARWLLSPSLKFVQFAQ
ncbi:unnamed protein product [Protopolystoma xenopodis]|uniref:Uncharacterized protein n=1 Tax=Protopolystoma xenopodis TaxID=117903 RepID=A0A448WTQ6_9PLAT|nr:unnamed protein product [Protopolystoma xenopodis]